MTYRVIWIPLGTFFPDHADVATEDEADALHLRMSREVGGEVSVHLLPEPNQESTP